MSLGGMTLAPIQLMAVILKMQIPLRPMQQITNNLPLFMYFIRSPNNWTSFLQAAALMSFTTTTSSELVTPGAAPATRLFAEAMVCFDANLDTRPLGTVGGRFLLLGDLGRGGCLWEEPKGRESIQQWLQWTMGCQVQNPKQGGYPPTKNNKLFYELLTIINAHIGKVYTHKRKGSYSEGCIAN